MTEEFRVRLADFPDVARSEAIRRLSMAFGVPEQMCVHFVDRMPTIVKQNAPLDDARQYVGVLVKLGAVATLENQETGRIEEYSGALKAVPVPDAFEPEKEMPAAKLVPSASRRPDLLPPSTRETEKSSATFSSTHFKEGVSKSGASVPGFNSREAYEDWKARKQDKQIVFAAPASQPLVRPHLGDGQTTSAKMPPASQEALETQARADLEWGHNPRRVESKLIEGGMHPREAKEFVESLKSTRETEARVEGMKKLITGLVVAVFGGAIWFILDNATGEVRINLAVLALPFFGLAWAGHGLAMIIGGSKAERGDSDILG